jgi:hypothetical protein
MPFPEFPPAFLFLRNQISGNRSQYNRIRMPLKIESRWQRECSHVPSMKWKCTEISAAGLSYQCCGSGMTMDLRSGFFYPRYREKKAPNPRSGSAIRILSTFCAKNCSWALKNMIRYVYPRSRFRIFSNPEPGSAQSFFSTAGRIITSGSVSVSDPD